MLDAKHQRQARQRQILRDAWIARAESQELGTGEDRGGDGPLVAERGDREAGRFIGVDARCEGRALEIGVVLLELEDGALGVDRGDAASEQLESQGLELPLTHVRDLRWLRCR